MCPGTGDLSKLDVWHDSSGPQPGWLLDYIEVKSSAAGKVGRMGLHLFIHAVKLLSRNKEIVGARSCCPDR